MNNQIRRRLKLLHQQMAEVQSSLEEIKDDEQNKLDNLPESLQDSDKAEAFITAVDCIDEAINCLEDAMSNVDDSHGH